MALDVGEPMRQPIGPEHVGVHQRAGIAAIGLDLPRPRRVHRGEVRVGDDHLVAKALETAGDPFAVGGGLEQDPRSGARAEHCREALPLGPDTLLDQFPAVGQDADLAFPLVDVDANMVHGWPLPPAALTACSPCGALYATTSSGRPAAFIPSVMGVAPPAANERGERRSRLSLTAPLRDR